MARMTSRGFEFEDKELGSFQTELAELRRLGYLSPSWRYSANEDTLDSLQKAMLQNRRRKDTYSLLGQQKRPTLAPEMERRIRALEDESKPTSLVEDPFFQADRAKLATGGRQALASVENTQKAEGNSGGFSNQGSVTDIYDRLGAEMATLGQRSTELKSKKADTAAQARQGLLDAQVNFDNVMTQAKLAYETGDVDQIMAAIDRAAQVRAEKERAEKQFWGSLLSGVLTAGIAPAIGAISGAGKKVAAATSESGFSADDTWADDASAVKMGGYAPRVSKPWAAMRGRT